MTKSQLIDNWWGDDTNVEALMEDEHAPQWMQIIDLMTEDTLAGSTVLDFGCNQGGFLRLLHARKPFAEGYGVDIAQNTIEQARQRSSGLPAAFIATTDLTKEDVEAKVDVAFSNEVVYLLPSLEDHAAAIKYCLKPGGVYYLSLSSHTDNPMWPRWKKLIEADSPVTVQDYSLTDISDVFNNDGFSVAARPFRPEGFMPVSRSNEWFGTPQEVFDYYYRQKVLFRIQKDK